MQRQSVPIVIAAAVLVVITTTFLWANRQSSDDLDSFLTRRTQALAGLAESRANPPEGVELAMPNAIPRTDPLHPGDEHIRSVLRSTTWYQHGFENTPLELSAEFLEERSGTEATEELVDYYSRGLKEAGLSPMPSDRPNIDWHQDYAVGSRVWRDADAEFTVIVQVDVYPDALKAHLTRYVVERVDH